MAPLPSLSVAISLRRYVPDIERGKRRGEGKVKTGSVCVAGQYYYRCSMICPKPKCPNMFLMRRSTADWVMKWRGVGCKLAAGDSTLRRTPQSCFSVLVRTKLPQGEHSLSDFLISRVRTDALNGPPSRPSGHHPKLLELAGPSRAGSGVRIR